MLILRRTPNQPSSVQQSVPDTGITVQRQFPPQTGFPEQQPWHKPRCGKQEHQKAFQQSAEIERLGKSHAGGNADIPLINIGVPGNINDSAARYDLVMENHIHAHKRVVQHDGMVQHCSGVDQRTVTHHHTVFQYAAVFETDMVAQHDRRFNAAFRFDCHIHPGMDVVFRGISGQTVAAGRFQKPEIQLIIIFHPRYAAYRPGIAAKLPPSAVKINAVFVAFAGRTYFQQFQQSGRFFRHGKQGAAKNQQLVFHE